MVNLPQHRYRIRNRRLLLLPEILLCRDRLPDLRRVLRLLFLVMAAPDPILSRNVTNRHRCLQALRARFPGLRFGRFGGSCCRCLVLRNLRLSLHQILALPKQPRM
jgi:hypothetical protein